MSYLRGRILIFIIFVCVFSRCLLTFNFSHRSFLFVCFNLAALGLSCGMRGIFMWCMGFSLVVARGLSSCGARA